MSRYRRILITGAAGNLGRELRAGLRPLAETLRLTDIAELSPAGEGEELVQADLSDRAAVGAMMEGVDAVVHFGGVPNDDKGFEQILAANIVGGHNVWESARQHGVRRIIFASSNHAIGMHPRTTRLDADSAHRPDGYYGLSKCFVEDLARMFWDKHGIEAACLRIGSCFPEPTGERMLSTWLSYGDMVRLVTATLTAPHLGFAVVYGMSNNARLWWDNGKVGHIGYQPQDSADAFADKLLGEADPSDLSVYFQGGGYSKKGYSRKALG